MDERRNRARDPRALAAIGAALGVTGTVLTFGAAWGAAASVNGELEGLGRLALQLTMLVHQAWYALLCPATLLLCSTAVLLPFGRRSPAGCGWAVAVGGLLLFGAGTVLSLLVHARP